MVHCCIGLYSQVVVVCKQQFIVVSGCIAEWLCISNVSLYAISDRSEVYMRLGITSLCDMGKVWKKIPGKMLRLAGKYLPLVASVIHVKPANKFRMC